MKLQLFDNANPHVLSQSDIENEATLFVVIDYDRIQQRIAAKKPLTLKSNEVQ